MQNFPVTITVFEMLLVNEKKTKYYDCLVLVNEYWLLISIINL